MGLALDSEALAVVSRPMGLHDALIVAAGFFSEVLGTLSGFGSSTFFVPAAVHLESYRFVLALTAILHCFANTSKVLLFRENLNRRDLLRLAIPFFIFTTIGALLTEYVDRETLKRVLAVALIGISILFLAGGLRFRKLPDWVGIALCTLSGFSTGLIGTGGAIRGVALAAMNLESGAFVALSAAIDFGGDFIRLIIYLWNGYMDWNQWFYIPLLGVAAYAGVKVGRFLLLKFSRDQFEKTVAVFILLSGILMLFE